MSVITGLINGIQPSCLVVSTAADDHQGLQPDVDTVGWDDGADLQHRQNTQAGALARSGLAFTDLLP
jgi:hypothetical protein